MCQIHIFQRNRSFHHHQYCLSGARLGDPPHETDPASFNFAYYSTNEPEPFLPNPPSAHCISMPHLMLHSQTSTKIGVLIKTLRTGKISGYCEGGLIRSPRTCSNAAAVCTPYSITEVAIISYGNSKAVAP